MGSVYTAEQDRVGMVGNQPRRVEIPLWEIPFGKTGRGGEKKEEEDGGAFIPHSSLHLEFHSLSFTYTRLVYLNGN